MMLPTTVIGSRPSTPGFVTSHGEVISPNPGLTWPITSRLHFSMFKCCQESVFKSVFNGGQNLMLHWSYITNKIHVLIYQYRRMNPRQLGMYCFCMCVVSGFFRRPLKYIINITSRAWRVEECIVKIIRRMDSNTVWSKLILLSSIHG